MKIKIIDGLSHSITLEGTISFDEDWVIIKTYSSRELKRFPITNVLHIDDLDTIYLK